MLGSVSVSALAQSQTVKGVVKDETGEPLPKAVVSIKESKGIVTADEHGAFTIKADRGQLLIISYIGYETRTIEIKDGAEINIVLDPRNTEMGEAIVVGYGTQRRSDIATAISSVNMEEIMKSVSTVSHRASI